MIEKEFNDAYDALSIGPQQPQQQAYQDVRALGWGVTCEVTLPGMPTPPKPSGEKVELRNEYGVWFKEGMWMGPWAGYVYTTVEANGTRLTGYKMDDTCEPCSTWNGPRPRKYFGLKDEVLGYHFDRAGPPLSNDPASDSKLREMGWEQPQKQPEESSATKEGEQKDNQDDKDETKARVSTEANTAAL